jgi:crotonobetainyl-CoA:carnitine CoA-transferase CaiB-like acyl-CoA transferase
MTGPKDGTPIKPSVPYQTWLFGCGHAVSAILLALRQRKRSGRGAHIDQAMRDTGLSMLSHTYQFYDFLGINLERYGNQRDIGGAVRLPNVFTCRDGYVIWLFQTGQRGKDTAILVDWMGEHGMADDPLLDQDWESFDLLEVEPEVPVRLAALFGAFFATKTKSELLHWAIENRVMLAPVQTLADLLADEQLASRQAWRAVDLGGSASVVVPGSPIRLSEGAWEPRGGPPLLGGANEAVYGGLGCTPAELARLRERGVV